MLDGLESHPAGDRDPEPTGPYQAELAQAGCPSCGRGERWHVTGPTKVDSGPLGFNEEEALHQANEMNAVYRKIQLLLSQPNG